MVMERGISDGWTAQKCSAWRENEAVGVFIIVNNARSVSIIRTMQYNTEQSKIH